MTAPAGAAGPAPQRAERAAGILLHVSSLPGPFGVGDLGPSAVRFLDWAAAAGQSLWQVLPLGPTGGGDSPYGGSSAFAGNPLFVSPERLAEDAWLEGSDLEKVARDSPVEISAAGFAAANRWKDLVLRRSFDRFSATASPEDRRALEDFRRAPAQSFWLSDWTLYAALRKRAGGAGWIAWSAGLAGRYPEELARARREVAEEAAFQEYAQFVFFRQWARVRAEASRRGISIVGDLPIYVAHDSADVWAHRDLFALDAAGLPEFVAGVPPDYFSETGQLWGYPVYRWDRHADAGWSWWIERLAANLRLSDAVRIDHFRGFASYWEVPAADKTALGGRWVAGPGRALFDAAARKLGPLPVIAEDLGLITPNVTELLDELRFPGMKVLQFAFSEDDSPHLPHRHVENAVVYTGTHDNDTTAGWAATLSSEERSRFALYTGASASDAPSTLLRLAYASVARRAIAPLQDVLGIGSAARMNTPGVAAGNWTWRASESDFTSERAAMLRRLAAVTGRLRSQKSP